MIPRFLSSMRHVTLKTWLFWGAFVALHVGLFVYGFEKQRNDPELYILNRIGSSVFVSRGAGLVLGLDCALILLPMCRNLLVLVRSSLPFAKYFVSFDDNIFFHKITALSMLFFTIVHVNAHFKNFFLVEERIPQLKMKAWNVHYSTWAGMTGHLMLIVMFITYTTTATKVRKSKFELFWFTHHLYFIFFLLLFFHSFGCFVKSATTGQCKGYNSNYFTIPAFTLYLLERILRIIRSREPTRITSVIFHPGNTLEIRFQKPQLQYQSGQYVYICVPRLSRFQWHPFTVSSAPDEGFVSVHIRLVGDWTKALTKLLQKVSDSNTKANLLPELLIDGPYGAPAQDLFRYEVAALISAGIGVTPSASLLKAVWFRYMQSSPMKLKKLFFIWIARDKHDFEWFQSLLRTLEQSIPREFLEIQIYLTGNLGVDDIQNIALTDNLFDLDPITELQTRCHFGRPHWDKIFTSIKATQFNPSKTIEVGLFYCGPQSLGQVIKKFTQKHSEDRFKFRLHKEHF